MSTVPMDRPNASSKGSLLRDYSQRYTEATRETLVGLYGRRDEEGRPVEGLNGIISRVATAVAVAELRYALEPAVLVDLTVDEALAHERVREWAEVFCYHIGNQFFWPNTPCNINADPEVSLKVLQYEAFGKLAGMSEEEIWLRSDALRDAVEAGDTGRLSEYELAMGALARDLRGRGCLAACGVTYVEDSIEGIQEAAKVEALAAKAAMGMGLNTSSLRPWSTITSNGAAASGPDRFYELSISKAVDAVAQGGRRGGALIELRNSDHPDILFFLDKKRLTPEPKLADVVRHCLAEVPREEEESRAGHLKRVMDRACVEFGRLYAEYVQRQRTLSNTNISVLSMPGFMEAAERKSFYPARFAGERWRGPVYDPRRPVIDPDSGEQMINPYTKEPVFEEYSVDLDTYPEARDAAAALPEEMVRTEDNRVTVRGHFYAPDVFARIADGMRTSGEPGIAFYNLINSPNANSHIYQLHTCNPCGEQFLPAGPGEDGRIYMGTCNLSSMHAAHQTFWQEGGGFDYSAMRAVASVMQRFMDNVTDVSWYPFVYQNLTARSERRNGGGFAGIAEHLSRLGLEFGSPEALKATEKLFSEYTEASVEASRALAEERGVYPLWQGSQWQEKGLKVRNTCMTNNAPTGTVAQAMQTSWGVDPHNGIVFARMVRSRLVDFVAPGFEDMMRKHDAWPEEPEKQKALMQKIRDNRKSCRGLAEVPEPVQKAFPIRIEVDPESYIRHLGAVHKGARKFPEAFNSASNTCSIPPGMPLEQVMAAVRSGYVLGVKDLTFYPDGSRLSQPVERIVEEELPGAGDVVSLLLAHEREPVSIDETEGVTYKVRVGSAGGMSTLHVSLNHLVDNPGRLIEVYARLGKSGAVESGLFEAVGRLASALLQYAAQFGEKERQEAEELVVHHLINIQSGYPVFFMFPGEKKSRVIQSPCDGLAKAILRYRDKYGRAGRKPPAEAAVDDPGAQAGDDGGKRLPEARRGDDEGLPANGPGGSVPYDDAGSGGLPSLLLPEQTGSECASCGGSDWTIIEGCITCEGCGYNECG